ncbi:MAG TPA: hypothetical protein P5173_04490 [Bacilli bacterium]|nr:hypothetical protein [Bacilli bacterium]
MNFIDIIAPEFYEEINFWYIVIGSVIVLITIVCFILFMIKWKRGNKK